MISFFALWVALTLGNAFYERVLTDGSWEQVASWGVAQAVALIAARPLTGASPFAPQQGDER